MDIQIDPLGSSIAVLALALTVVQFCWNMSRARTHVRRTSHLYEEVPNNFLTELQRALDFPFYQRPSFAYVSMGHTCCGSQAFNRLVMSFC